MLDNFGTLFLLSIKSVAPLLLQYLVGGLAAFYGYVKEADARAFAATMNLILVPCLSISSLGQGLSAEVLFSGGAWVLAIFNFVRSPLYALVGMGLRPLAKPDPPFARLLYAARPEAASALACAARPAPNTQANELCSRPRQRGDEHGAQRCRHPNCAL